MAKTYKGECVCFPVDETGLHPNEITVAEILHEAGYATALIGKWHLGDQPEFFPTRQGFDYYFGIPYSNDTGKGWFEHRGARQLYPQPAVPLMRGDSVIEAPAVQETITKRYTEEAIRFIKSHADEPFFLFLSHTMPHYPLHVSPDFADATGNGLYADVVTELDWSVGEILDALEESGLSENTLVVFTSDNGATGGYGYNTTNAPLSGWKGSAMEGGTRVPTIARWQGTIPSGKVSGALSSVMDLLPTFAHYAGAEVPEDRVIDGKSLHAILEDPEMAKSPHDFFAYYVTDQLQAITDPGVETTPAAGAQLYHVEQKTWGRWKARLYHLREDISESKDLSEAYPEIVEEMMVRAEMARKWIGDRDRPTLNSRPAGYEAKPVPLLK
jgi:arylsulfatase A